MASEKSKVKKLTPKQKIFIKEYLTNGFNATKAAITAGYSKKTACSQGNRLLTNVDIQEEILQSFRKAGFMVQTALRENTKILESDIKNYLQVVDGGAIEFIPFNQLAPGLTSNIKKIKNKRTIKENPDGSTVVYDEVELELYDKQKAISTVIDVSGIKTENIDITSNGETVEATTFVFLGKDQELPEYLKKKKND